MTVNTKTLKLTGKTEVKTEICLIKTYANIIRILNFENFRDICVIRSNKTDLAVDEFISLSGKSGTTEG